MPSGQHRKDTWGPGPNPGLPTSRTLQRLDPALQGGDLLPVEPVPLPASGTGRLARRRRSLGHALSSASHTPRSNATAEPLTTPRPEGTITMSPRSGPTTAGVANGYEAGPGFLLERMDVAPEGVLKFVPEGRRRSGG